MNISLTRKQETFYSVCGLVSVLLLWCVVTYGGMIRPLFLPSPTDIVSGLADYLRRGWLIEAIWKSTLRVELSMLLVLFVGVPIGFLMGENPRADAALRSIIGAAKAVPPTGVIALVVLWFSIEERAKIVFLFLGSIFYMILLVREAVQSVPQAYLNVAHENGASRWQTLTLVLLPAALPGIWAAVAVCNGIAWTYIVIAEFINSSESQMGLGYLLSIGSRTQESGKVFGVLILIALISSLTDWIPPGGTRKVGPVVGMTAQEDIGNSKAGETITDSIVFDKVSKGFRMPGRGFVPVLGDISFQVERAEFVALLGPSGCGKSTLLGLTSGALLPELGKVGVFGKEVKEESRMAATVSQHYTCFPWLTVRQNVEFGLKIQGVAPNERKSRAIAMLGKVGLTDQQNEHPQKLSGGQQQRVAIARALVLGPELILMDEPFGALDAQTRSEMQGLLLTLWADRHATVLFVTHDLNESILLADRIFVFGGKPVTTLLGEIHVPFPRPRSADLAYSSEFIALAVRLRDLLKGK